MTTPEKFKKYFQSQQKGYQKEKIQNIDSHWRLSDVFIVNFEQI